MLNNVCLNGRLTRDVELRQTNTGVPVATFSLAVERPFKNQQGEKEVDFINIVVWKSLGEMCARYLSKGKLAGISGRLQIRSYEGTDGIKRNIAEVVASTVDLLSPKDNETGINNIIGSNTEEFAIPDDDVPF